MTWQRICIRASLLGSFIGWSSAEYGLNWVQAVFIAGGAALIVAMLDEPRTTTNRQEDAE